ncbi:MAG TPA: LysR family transcriptional regulator [Nonomuraea sp.]|nr:LysR family transcriptional regulator [Nonomuraea sp.]
MDPHTFRQFLVVARLEHLSRAADELRIVQPSLSRTIARLESELGTPPVRSQRPTPAERHGQTLPRGYVERSRGELDAGRRAAQPMHRGHHHRPAGTQRRLQAVQLGVAPDGHMTVPEHVHSAQRGSHLSDRPQRLSRQHQFA